MDALPTFSERHGYTPPEAEITVRREAPLWLRDLVVTVTYDSGGLRPSGVRRILCKLLLETPDEHNWSEFPNIDTEARVLLGTAEWFQVYDFVELVADQLQEHSDPEAHARFAQDLNEVFRRKGVGWQLIEGRLQMRGPESFELSVRNATEHLAVTDRKVAGHEMHQALTDLSRRPIADITGAIQHAMAALECVARDLTGDRKATLGELLKKHPGLLPPPLDNALSKIWGFASEQGRHLRENGAPNIKEAELIVGLAACVTTYMLKKTLPEGT